MLGLRGLSREKNPNKSRTVTSFTDSHSDYITVANHADWQIDGEDFSACFFVKITEDASGTSNKDGIVGLKAGQFRQGGFWFEYKDDSSDDQHFSFWTSTASAKTGIDTTAVNIIHDEWYHVAATYDLSTTTGRIYLNGVLSKSSTSVTAPTAYTNDVGLGGWTPYVSSKVSDVAFWNGTVLTAAEILELSMRKNYHSYNITPTAYYRLDENSKSGSNNVLDVLENHHGTSSNMLDADFTTSDSAVTGV